MDAELVAGVRRGDREAAGRLAERYLRPARAVALSVVGELAAAEDVAQDAFVYAMDRIDDCRKPDRFGGWLLQIVRNRSLNHVRDRKADRHVPLDSAPFPSPEPSPQRDLARSRLRDRLLTALGQIRPDRREVVLLHDLEGWTHREIAERMDLPPGTVRSHLHHARRELRVILGDQREEDHD
jgi:RNA polymerase sigma-70 factor (ECF subfamily)